MGTSVGNRDATSIPRHTQTMIEDGSEILLSGTVVAEKHLDRRVVEHPMQESALHALMDLRHGDLGIRPKGTTELLGILRGESTLEPLELLVRLSLHLCERSPGFQRSR